MAPCDGTESSRYWCCGSNTDCCGTSDAIEIPAVFSEISLPPAATTTSAVTGTPSVGVTAPIITATARATTPGQGVTTVTVTASPSKSTEKSSSLKALDVNYGMVFCIYIFIFLELSIL